MKKIFLVMTLALIAIVTGCDRVQNIVAPEEMVEKPAELRVKEVMEELQELQKEFWDMGIPMVVPTPEIVAKDRSNSHFVYSNKEGVWVESLGMAPILLEKPLWATENLGLPGVAVAENITTERRGTTDYIVVLSQKPNAKAAIAHLYVGWNRQAGITQVLPHTSPPKPLRMDMVHME